VHAAELAAIFGAIGAVLAVILNVPQTWTSCARREIAGLSPTARWLAVLQSATWCAYALTDGTSSQLYSSAVCGVLHLAVLGALLLLCPAARESTVPLAVASLAWLVLVGWAAIGGRVDVGLLAAGCGTAAVVPQVVRLVRERDTDTSGISPLTCWLGIACSVAWLLHGALVGAEAVWLPSLIAAAASVLTLLLTRPGRARPCVGVEQHGQAAQGRQPRTLCRSRSDGRLARVARARRLAALAVLNEHHRRRARSHQRGRGAPLPGAEG
jgi:uncharacterized protein with PQ loop repeat